jgi:hypothetical protein
VKTIPQPPEGKVPTAAERADHAARMERARTGRQLPRTIHALIEQGAKLTGCTACGAGPGSWCLCEPHGIHLCRFARARASGLLTAAEFASVIADADVFTGSTVVLDGAA